MKKFCFALTAGFIALSSCLSESGQKVQLDNYVGVVTVRGDSTFVALRGGDVIYASTGINGAEDGDCLFLNFTIDYSLTENADSGRIKGYLTATVTATSPITQQELSTVLQDTVTPSAGERFIKSISQYDAFISDRFFLFTTHAADTLPPRFSLSSAPTYADDGVYDFFLRVNAETNQSASTQPTSFYNAFDVGNLNIQNTDSIFFRLHYVQKIAGDTALVWTATPVYRFARR
jgi:hypothetical protein